MASKRFSAQVEAFVTKAKLKLETVVKEAAQDVFRIAQTPVAQGGNMPVDTGFLRNTFVSELNGGGLTSGPDAYILSIAGYELGDTIFGGWTAEYAMRMEYGFVGEDAAGRNFNQAGRFFMNSAAQQWQQIVARHAAEIRNM